MVRSRFLVVIMCVVLALAACGRSAPQIDSDPNLDASDILSKAMNRGASQQLISDHDQTVTMDAVLTVSMDNMTMKMDMNLDSKESGDQRMSEVGVNMKLSAGSGKTSDVKLYMFLQQEGEGYHAYARLGQGAGADKKGQEKLSEDGARSLLDHMQQSSMASVEMYAENPEKVGAKEEGGNYVVQLIPSREALMNIAKKTGSGNSIENLSNSRCLLTMVVDKNTYHMKSFSLELEADVTSQGQKAKMDMKVNATSDETKEVTLSVPSDLQDAPEANLKTFFS